MLLGNDACNASSIILSSPSGHPVNEWDVVIIMASVKELMSG